MSEQTTKAILKQEFEFPLIDPDLHWEVSSEELHEEFFWYLDHPRVDSDTKEPTLVCNHNKIVKYFQQDVFYAVEKEMWKDPKLKKVLLANRLKYLSKAPDELTTYDILSGFKRSALHYGYSGFNPQLCKWYYDWVTKHVGIKMNDIICYDPTGGWGHRMLGSTEIKKYIYNDLSWDTAQNVYYIKEYFDFYNCEIHSENAQCWHPEDDYNVVFTCPPYFNLEYYPCGEFPDREYFNEFMNDLYKLYSDKPSCKVLGLVMREDMINCLPPADHVIPLKKTRSVHLNGNTKSIYGENLYIWTKPSESISSKS